MDDSIDSLCACHLRRTTWQEEQWRGAGRTLISVRVEHALRLDCLNSDHSVLHQTVAVRRSHPQNVAHLQADLSCWIEPIP